MDQNQVNAVCPHPVGWLEYTLSEDEINYLWECVANKGPDYKAYLIGHIAHSYQLADTNNWFFENVLLPLLNRYIDEFSNIGMEIPLNVVAPYYLDKWWVNYQHQGDFNPLHTHGSVYSFAIWLKIPTEHMEQNDNPISKGTNHGGIPRISCFEFAYTDILGRINNYTYALNKSDSVKMLFFPAKLHHIVYPYYNCDEDRITISGNIGLDAMGTVNQKSYNNEVQGFKQNNG